MLPRKKEYTQKMAAIPTPVDYAYVTALSMNMAGRFSGREIRNFGQGVIKHILMQKQIPIFIGQQINFKLNLPGKFRFVGTNKAFVCYDSAVFKANDERQYRHFLRDLHLRGQMPHHYLPDNNYVVMKMRYRQKPWSEFVAMSWVTDEKQTKVKNQGYLRKVLNYVVHLSEAEEMPVVVGGSFRMELEEIKREMVRDVYCYGYLPTTPRRKMRMCSVFLCVRPVKIRAVKPLVCSKMTFEMNQSSRWLNPEDAFYWDPVIAEIMFPIQTPESLEKARMHEERVNVEIGQRLEMSSQTRPITGISSKHLLISSMMARSSGVSLPTAPVLPTPQEQQLIPPPPSPVESTSCQPSQVTKTSTVGDLSCLLPAIDEVSSEYERRDSIYSNTETVTGDNPVPPQADQEGEDKMFELLEAMMNDRSSTFFVSDEISEQTANTANLDPIIFSLLKGNKCQSLEELKATVKARIQAGACSSENLPENVAEMVTQDMPFRHYSETDSRSSSMTDLSAADECAVSHTEVESLLLGSFRRIPSYQELYDEELIESNTHCYMS